MKKLYNNRGYTLLFAAIIAALVLGVAVFILSVSRKQYILASTARDSMFSIYAADSGIECIALRNGNLNGDGDMSDKISSTTIRNGGGFNLYCNGGTFFIEEKTGSLYHPAFEEAGQDWEIVSQASGYIFTGSADVKTCAEIMVTTGINHNGNKKKKVFDSRGYNLCTETSPGSGVWEPDFASPRTVERALRLTYLGSW